MKRHTLLLIGLTALPLASSAGTCPGRAALIWPCWWPPGWPVVMAPAPEATTMPEPWSEGAQDRAPTPTPAPAPQAAPEPPGGEVTPTSEPPGDESPMDKTGRHHGRSHDRGRRGGHDGPGHGGPDGDRGTSCP